MEDFESSAERHFFDAEQLRASGRLDNAGHLFGISGECVLKAICLEGVESHPHRHFTENAKKDLRSAAMTMLVGRRGPRVAEILAEVFAGWEVDQRYHSTGSTTSEQVSAWRADAEVMIEAMRGL